MKKTVVAPIYEISKQLKRHIEIRINTSQSSKIYPIFNVRNRWTLQDNLERERNKTNA